MSIVPTLLVAVVTFIAIMPARLPRAEDSDAAQSPASCVFIAPPPYSCGLFLARAAVRRHISASKSCREAGLGFREVHVEARAVDVMAGAGGAAGLAPDVRHQPPGDTECCERKQTNYTV